MKGVITKKFHGCGTWDILGEDGVEYFLGYHQCMNKEKHFKEGATVTFDVKDTGKNRLEAWNCVAEEPPKPVATRGDKLRELNNRELARWIATWAGNPGNPEEVDYWDRWLSGEVGEVEF